MLDNISIYFQNHFERSQFLQKCSKSTRQRYECCGILIGLMLKVIQFGEFEASFKGDQRSPVHVFAHISLSKIVTTCDGIQQTIIVSARDRAH